MTKIPVAVTHYSRNDPRKQRGGVETFARDLTLFFDDVEFMTPKSLDIARVYRSGRMVIADNQWSLHWPDRIPVVAFQHGVAADKATLIGSKGMARVARQQAKVAKRPNTIRVACADWISRRFDELHGSPAQVVIRHPVDTTRFDGQPRNRVDNLILHDARSEHKGRDVVAQLALRFPSWKLEPLDCHPTDVPSRMASARGFLHISRYEGNSIVVNEALAMNLPCFVTDVGLMRDLERPEDVHMISAERAFGDADYTAREFQRFLDSLQTRCWNPRSWVVRNSGREAVRQRWEQVVELWQPLQDAAFAQYPDAGDLGQRLLHRPFQTALGELRRLKAHRPGEAR
jgi:glycosyltransferase involved in cell wall biosynthesis